MINHFNQNSQPRIMVVDDEKDILRIIKRDLETNNQIRFNVDIFSSAESALEAFENHPDNHYDLVLTDIRMPRMNGFQACQQIKQQESTSKIPIIMATTRGEAESMEKGFEHGCNDYITKPMNRLELLSKVKNYIGE